MKTIEVPTFRVGLVLPPPEIDICMDGAEFLLLTKGNMIRLKTSNKEAFDVLERLKGTRMPAAVAGYWRQGAECRHLEVYHAASALGSERSENSLTANSATVEGIGYSMSLNYAEALEAAIEDAESKDPQPFAHYDIETWASSGGFIGMNVLYVKVTRR